MSTILKVICTVLLIFNALGALYGGAALILHPDGSSLQLSLDWLKHTAFSNYLVPGIVLFFTNGVLSCIVLALVFMRTRNHALYIIGQGAVLTGWILIQMLLIRTVYFLHLIMGGTGITLMICGYFLYRKNTHER